jgi:hypothetical protein
MSNPSFKSDIVFKAEKHFDLCGSRKYSEIHWSDFWWETQVNYNLSKLTKIKKFTHPVHGLQCKLPLGATVVPILLGIDQTNCAVLGRTKMYPLYMSIGNLPKKIRQTYSRNSFQVIAYFPILEGTPKDRSLSQSKSAPVP